MGERDAARIDTVTVLAVAGRFDVMADELAAVVRTRMARLSYGGAVAGRAHRVAGEALRNAVDDLAINLRTWSRSDAEVAAALRASVESYRDAEVRGAARLS